MLRFTKNEKMMLTKNKKVLAILICCFIVGITFALTMNPVYADFWSSGDAAQTLGQQFVELYKKWFFPLFIVNVFVYIISKNDKVKGAAKVVAIGLCVLYVICAMTGGGESFVTNTLDKIAEWFN